MATITVSDEHAAAVERYLARLTNPQTVQPGEGGVHQALPDGSTILITPPIVTADDEGRVLRSQQAVRIYSPEASPTTVSANIGGQAFALPLGPCSCAEIWLIVQADCPAPLPPEVEE